MTGLMSATEVQCLTAYVRAEGESEEALAARIEAIKSECVNDCKASDAGKTAAFFAKGDALGKTKPQLIAKDFEEVVSAAGLGSITTADNVIRAARCNDLRAPEIQGRLPRSDAAKIDLAAWKAEERRAYFLSGRMHPSTTRQVQKEWIEEYRRQEANAATALTQETESVVDEAAAQDDASAVSEKPSFDDLAIERALQEDVLIALEPLSSFRFNNAGITLLVARNDGYEMPILGSVNNDDLIRSVVTHLAKTKLTLVDKPLQAIFDIVKASSMPGAALPTDDEQSRTWLRDKYPDPCDLPGLDQQERSFKALHLSAGVLSLSNAGMKASVATRCILKERLFETETRLHLDSRALPNIVRWNDTNEIAAMKIESVVGHDLHIRDQVNGDRHVLSFNNGKTLARPIFKGHEFEPLWSFEASYDWLQTLDKWTSRFFAGQGKHNHIAKPKNRTMGITVAAQDLTIEFNHREGREPEKYLIALPHTIGVNKPHSTSYFSKDLAPVLYRLARANVVGDVTISGNEHALLVEYKTLSGTFEIATPALTDDASRDDTAFMVMGGYSAAA